MRITRRHHAALSIAAVLAAGSLTLTACGNSADPATAGSAGPAADPAEYDHVSVPHAAGCAAGDHHGGD